MNCEICKKIVISNSVTFSGGTLNINIPAGTYNDDENYCILVAQTIPTSTTIGSSVFVTIGSGTQQYQLCSCDGTPVTACKIGKRNVYPVRVETTPTSAVFRLTRHCCCVNRNLSGVNGTAPVATVEVSNANNQTVSTSDK
jgi:hypothetical protein